MAFCCSKEKQTTTARQSRAEQAKAKRSEAVRALDRWLCTGWHRQCRGETGELYASRALAWPNLGDRAYRPPPPGAGRAFGPPSGLRPAVPCVGVCSPHVARRERSSSRAIGPAVYWPTWTRARLVGSIQYSTVITHLYLVHISGPRGCKSAPPVPSPCGGTGVGVLGWGDPRWGPSRGPRWGSQAPGLVTIGPGRVTTVHLYSTAGAN